MADRPMTAVGSLAIILSIIAMILASPARAEIRTLPGGTTEIAVKRIGCSVVIDGKELMNGICHHRLTNNADVFLTLPEATTQIVVSVSRRGPRRVWLWTGTPDGKQGRQSLGANILVPQGECQRPNEWVVSCPCWANERVRICSWSLQTPSETPPHIPLPPQQTPAPPSEQRLYDLQERTTRMLEKLTGQPPVR